MKKITVSFVFVSVLILLFANMSAVAVGDDDSEYKMGPAPVFAGFEHSDLEDGFWHGPGKEMPYTNGCIGCHGADLMGIPGFTPSCYSCHGMEWDEKGPPPVFWGFPHPDEEDGFYHGAGKEMPFDNGCTNCHGGDLRGGADGFPPSCYSCHGAEWEDDDYSDDDYSDDDYSDDD